MDFRILGTVEVWDGGRALEIRRPKELLLLAVLLLHANELVPMERIVDELWPLAPPAKPAEAIQELVYQLRKQLERERERGSVLRRVGDAYGIVVPRGSLDVQRFERLFRQGEESKREGDLQRASSTFAEALAIWRGPPLANVACEPLTASRSEAARLEEVRLNAVIERIGVDLELGDDGELIGELLTLVADHPLDERLRRLLMLAFYRAGRQADALEVYRQTRATLDAELGIEPGRPLRELEQMILRHDPALDPGLHDSVADGAAAAPGERSIVVAAFASTELEPLLAVAEPLGRSQLARELVIALIVRPTGESLEPAIASVTEQRTRLLERGTPVRAAAFSSPAPAEDLVRLAKREDVDLLLMPAGPDLAEHGTLSPESGAVLAEAPCDVGLVTPSRRGPAGDFVLVPFGGLAHDWAALELGAWAATAMGLPIKLVGVHERAADGRDSSRMLADASLLLQAFLGISAAAQLVRPGPAEILEASDNAALLVAGLPDRWRQDGVGATRTELARSARAPVVLVRKGSRPGGLAPRESTVFAWSLTNVGARARS